MSIPKQKKNSVKKFLQTIIPGFVTGSSDDDPSGIGTYSMSGAKYGLLLAWLVPFLLPMMYVVQEMSARIGLITGDGLTANMKKFFSRPILYAAILILVFSNVVNIGANIAIMSESLGMITGINIKFLAIAIAVITIIMEILVSYHVYSKILALLTLSLFSYVATSLMVTENWLEVCYYTFVPHFNFSKDFILVMAGVIGTTISPYLFFWQASQEVEESKENGIKGFSGRYRKKRLKGERQGTFIGMFFSQIIALFIMVTCFATLHKSGMFEIETAHDAAMALKPLAGDWASLVFTLGIIGAGFLAIPVLAGSVGYALSEIFNHRSGLLYYFMDAPFFNAVIAISTLIGLFINFSGIHPIKALLFAAVINCIGAVPLLAFVILLASNKKVMGRHTSSLFSNIIGWITFVVMLISSVLVILFSIK